jgi:hypothetical protein
MAASKLAFAASAAIVALALIWWWATFGDVIRYGYLSWGEAGRCLVRDSDICALAKVLCLGSHPRALIAYRTSAFWLGLGVISLSLMAPSLRPEPAPKKRRSEARIAVEEAPSP